MYTSDLGKTEMIKQVQAVSAAGELCMLHKGLCQSINALCARLDTYNAEVWSILHEWEICVASVKGFEEALVEEEETDEEMKLRQEKAWYNAKRAVAVRKNVGVEEEEDEGEGEGENESEEEDNEPMDQFGLSVKVQGKCPVK